MPKRPGIKIKLSPLDISLEILTMMLLIIFWVIVLINYTKLPDIIPTHFNAKGEADGFGNKNNILFLPIITSVLYIGLTVLNNFPHAFNFPVKVTEENALKQYTLAIRIMRIIKLAIVISFGFIAYKTIISVKGDSNGLGTWFTPVFITIVSVPMIYYVIKSFRAR